MMILAMMGLAMMILNVFVGVVPVMTRGVAIA
jgi:hypothetical protein